MKKFILKISFYSISIIGMILLFNGYFLNKQNYYYGEWGDLQARIEYLKFNELDINTLFIGSSLVRHHIKPIVFDSICGTRSFNLGSNGMFVPSSYALAENILKDQSFNINYLIIDYSFVRDISKYLGTEKSYYWIKPKILGNALSSIFYSDYSLETKLALKKQYTLSGFYKYLSLGTPSFVKRKNKRKISNYEMETQGYYSLDYQLKNQPKEQLLASRKLFIQDTTKLQDRYSDVNLNWQKEFNTNPGIKSLIENLILLGDLKNINIIFLLQPNDFTEQIVADFIETIPTTNRIDISRDKNLYLSKFHFDSSHLNDKGATYFSKELANKFNKLKN